MNGRLFTMRTSLVAGVMVAALTVPAMTQQKGADGWISLFDGKTLNGWRGYKTADATGTRWAVTDGMLCIPQDNGKDTHGARDIISKDTFDQFELTWEWRVAEGGNSGLKYFVLEDRDAAIGHEYQEIDDARHADAKIGPHRQTAALYDVFPAADRPVKPAGEFNQSKVVVKGKTVEHWLNGKKVLTYELESDALKQAIAKSKFKDIERFGKLHKGHILLQDHGNNVCYRNIKIKPLTGAAGSQ